MRTGGAALALETDALADAQSGRLRAGLEAAGLKQERRSLRLRPTDLQWEWPAHDVLRVSFDLPPGSYATTVLAELGNFGAID